MAKGRGSLKFEEGSKSSTGKNYLLVIGINDYQHFFVLNNAVRDAETIREILLENYQFQAEYTTSLFDEEATRENILEALYKYQRIVSSNDNLLIYFAGHGIMNGDIQGFWIPIEAQAGRFSHYISNANILDILKNIKTHHTYLIIDSCFSGSMILREAEKEKNLVESLPSRRVLTSGRKQVVADGPIGGHSPFANCIIQFLRNNPSESISALDLEYHVQKNTPRNADQSPEASFIYGLGDQSGQFVFYAENVQKEIEWADLEGHLEACKNYIKDNTKGKFLEEAYWEIARLTDKTSDFRIYARKFRRGKFIAEALLKINSQEEKESFEKAKKRGWTALMQFINQYPDSSYADEAETEIERIEAEEEEKNIIPSQKEIVEGKSKSSKPKGKPTPKGPFEMVFVEGGSFMMGGEENDHEKPIHKVTLESFQIGKYPVTQKQWQDIMGDNPSSFKNCLDCPVESVSWDDVQEFLQELNSRYPRMNYRLPTEAEWEYAARGGTQSKGFIYAGSNKPNETGWFIENSGKKTHPISQKISNELEIFDMSGNVWEWCADWFDIDYYKISPKNNPQGPKLGSSRVIRGGGWDSSPQYLRVADRFSFSPDFRLGYFGLRLARSI